MSEKNKSNEPVETRPVKNETAKNTANKAVSGSPAKKSNSSGNNTQKAGSQKSNPQKSGSQKNNSQKSGPAKSNAQKGNAPKNNTQKNNPQNNAQKNNSQKNNSQKNNSQKNSTPKKESPEKAASTPVKSSPAKPAAAEAPRPEAPRPRTIAGQIVEYNPDPEEIKAKEAEESIKEDNLELATMSFRERRKVKKARREKEMEGMTKGERFKYLLYYYQWPIIITTFTAGCLIWLILAVTRSQPPVALSVAVLNNAGDKYVDELLFDSYMDESNIRSTYRVVVESFHLDQETLMQDYAQSPYSGDFSRFPILARDSYYDIVLCDRGGLDYCANTEIARYPDYVMPTDIQEKLKPYEVKAKDVNGNYWVYGYDISDTEFAKSLDLGYTQIFLCFPGETSESQMHAEHFVRYIFNLPDEDDPDYAKKMQQSTVSTSTETEKNTTATTEQK